MMPLLSNIAVMSVADEPWGIDTKTTLTSSLLSELITSKLVSIDDAALLAKIKAKIITKIVITTYIRFLF
jgi:hypothetical protein